MQPRLDNGLYESTLWEVTGSRTSAGAGSSDDVEMPIEFAEIDVVDSEFIEARVGSASE